MNDYREAFPDFGELDVVLPPGFVDGSFRQDSCPTFINEEAGLFLFVDYANPDDREVPDLQRFSLVQGTPHPVHGLQRDNQNIDLISTDDWAEVIETLERHLSDSSAPRV